MQLPRGSTAYRLAVGIALAAMLLLVWLSLGVGIIGRDGDPANIMYLAMVAFGIVGRLVVRGRPTGMARVLLAMSFVQGLIAMIAVIFGLGMPWSGPAEILVLNAFFVFLFAASAWLFQRAGGDTFRDW